MEQIDMYHPVTGGRARTTEAAFDAVWSRKGWSLTPPRRDGGPTSGTPAVYTIGEYGPEIFTPTPEAGGTADPQEA